jgi:hypothetical protein
MKREREPGLLVDAKRKTKRQRRERLQDSEERD